MNTSPDQQPDDAEHERLKTEFDEASEVYREAFDAEVEKLQRPLTSRDFLLGVSFVAAALERLTDSIRNYSNQEAIEETIDDDAERHFELSVINSGGINLWHQWADREDAREAMFKSKKRSTKQQ